MSTATATPRSGRRRDLAAELLREIRAARDRLESGERIPRAQWERILAADVRLHGDPPRGHDR